MSTEQDEIDAALDNLESDNGVTLADLDDDNQGQVIEGNAEAIENTKIFAADDDDPEPKEEDDPPPGYIGYVEWVASGKDPKKFRGEDAYTAQYDQIQETREVKSQLAAMQETLKHVATANDEWRNNQRESMRAEIAQELELAKESSDVDAALLAQAKLDNLNVAPTQQPAPQESPIISEFRHNNPMTDRSSPKFNPDFNADVEGFYNAMVDDLTGKGQRAMTEGQVGRCLQLAQKKAADLSPNLFESPRNQRQTTGAKRKKGGGGSTTDYRAKLKGIGNARNAADSNAAIDMYDMLLKSGGKESADNFAKANLGE